MRPLKILGIYAILIAGAVVILGPFVLSVMTSLKTPQQLATQSKLALPAPVTLENFQRLFSGELVDFSRSIAVTAGYVGIVLVGQLVFSILAAYAFARVEFPGRDTIFWVYLATLMVPAVVTIVPLYLIISEMGLRSTFWGLVLPYLFGSPYAISSSCCASTSGASPRSSSTQPGSTGPVRGASFRRSSCHCRGPSSRPSASSRS